MTGQLDITCSHCRKPIQWRKVEFTRRDSYPDWCLEVFCDCGLFAYRDHPFLYGEARAAYDSALGIELETQQRNLLDAALDGSGNLDIETLVQALPSFLTEERQG